MSKSNDSNKLQPFIDQIINEKNNLFIQNFFEKDITDENRHQLLEESKIDINGKIQGNKTLLMLAVEKGKDYVVHFLLNSYNDKSIVDINKKNEDGTSALIIAVEWIAIKLLKTIENISMKYIKNNYTECLNILLQNERINPNITDRDNNTSLHILVNTTPFGILTSVEKNKYEYLKHFIIKFLNNGYINIILQNKHGYTVLMLAVEKLNLDLVKLLLDFENEKKNLSSQSTSTKSSSSSSFIDPYKKLTNKFFSGFSSLYSSTNIPDSSSHNDDFSSSSSINKLDPGINLQNNNGNTVLIITAMKHFMITSIISLLSKRISTSQNDPEKEELQTEIYKYLEEHSNSFSILQFLLENETADPNIKNYEGNTLLHILSPAPDLDEYNNLFFRYLETTYQMLLKNNKINFNIKNKDGNTALMIAVLTKNISIVKHLLGLNSKKYQVKPNNSTSSKQQQPLLQGMSRLNINNSGVSSKKKQRQQQQQQLPLKAMSRLNINHNVSSSTHPLRVDPNIRNNDGYSALAIAVLRGDKNIVELLLNDKNVDPNTKNYYDDTPLMIAVQRGDKNIVELLKNKSDSKIINIFGETPEMMETLLNPNGNEDAKRSLLENRCDYIEDKFKTYIPEVEEKLETIGKNDKDGIKDLEREKKYFYLIFRKLIREGWYTWNNNYNIYEENKVTLNSLEKEKEVGIRANKMYSKILKKLNEFKEPNSSNSNNSNNQSIDFY